MLSLRQQRARSTFATPRCAFSDGQSNRGSTPQRPSFMLFSSCSFCRYSCCYRLKLRANKNVIYDNNCNFSRQLSALNRTCVVSTMNVDWYFVKYLQYKIQLIVSAFYVLSRHNPSCTAIHFLQEAVRFYFQDLGRQCIILAGILEDLARKCRVLQDLARKCLFLQCLARKCLDLRESCKKRLNL